MTNNTIPPLDGQIHEVHHFNGNIVLIPRIVFIQLGNLDPYFSHSKGDFDYGMRAKKVGVKLIQARQALGECDTHPSIDKWCNPKYPFTERWKAMFMPNGMPPNETFYLEKKHIGLITATFHWFTILVRCLVPQLWVKLKAK